MNQTARFLRGTGLLRSLPALAALALVSCAPNVNDHGNAPKPKDVAAIEPGVTTRAQVQALLGTPAGVLTFDDNSWYYVGTWVEKYMFFEPEIVQRDVVIVRFGPDDVVTAVDRLDKKDGQEVALVERETETRGRSLTLLQQLFGNLGRFNTPRGAGPGR